MIFGMILGCVLWYMLGILGVWSVEDEFNDFNPLWEIVLILAGPISILVWMGICVFKSIQSYIKRVKDYYHRKQERREAEERRKLRRSVWGEN